LLRAFTHTGLRVYTVTGYVTARCVYVAFGWVGLDYTRYIYTRVATRGYVVASHGWVGYMVYVGYAAHSVTLTHTRTLTTHTHGLHTVYTHRWYAVGFTYSAATHRYTVPDTLYSGSLCTACGFYG